jgi:oligopeptide/dipeptide ABC transporter ATP-binding protein
MYLGKIVEVAPTEALFSRPKHPYTEALMSAVPIPDPRLRDQRQHILLEGEIPSARKPPPGCAFHPRCRYAEAVCRDEEPGLEPLDARGRVVACHFPERVKAGIP